MRTGACMGIIILLGFVLNSCEKEKAVPVPLTAGCNITNITFTNSVQAIINNSCAYSISCHAAGTAYADLSTYQGVKECADNGQLYQQLIVTGRMPPPPQPPLDICQITQIKVWIDAGAPQ